MRDKCKNHFRSSRTGFPIGFRNKGETEIKCGSQVSGWGNWLDGWMHRLQDREFRKADIEQKRIRSSILDILSLRDPRNSSV